MSSNQFTWLITGAAGFIGSNLVEALLRLNQKVVGIDNFLTGYRHNIEEVLSSVGSDLKSNFTFYEADIRSLEDCHKAVAGVDYVLHHAALGSVPESIKSPDAVNVSGFVNMLLAARDAGVKRFVYASSSSVYGDLKTLPAIEDKTGNLLSPYAVSKYTNELYAKVFADCYGLQTVGLRYFNVFGSRQDPKGAYAAVIPLWIEALLSGRQAFINGDGENTRDFCYIEDVVQANVLSALTKNNQTINQVYNIAVGEQTSLNQLFNIIREGLNLSFDIKPAYRAFREGDIKHSLADIEKAKTFLGYRPNYHVKEGLELALKWYVDFLK